MKTASQCVGSFHANSCIGVRASLDLVGATRGAWDTGTVTLAASLDAIGRISSVYLWKQKGLDRHL